MKYPVEEFVLFGTIRERCIHHKPTGALVWFNYSNTKDWENCDTGIMFNYIVKRISDKREFVNAAFSAAKSFGITHDGKAPGSPIDPLDKCNCMFKINETWFPATITGLGIFEPGGNRILISGAEDICLADVNSIRARLAETGTEYIGTGAFERDNYLPPDEPAVQLRHPVTGWWAKISARARRWAGVRVDP
jgi:hypothetical protein